MKLPALMSFHFKTSSNDQDKLSLNTSGDNTDACLPLIPDACKSQKTQERQHSYTEDSSEAKLGTHTKCPYL